MPRSEEADAFFYGVWQAVQKIPHGKVTTYSHIALLIGTPERPRQVGMALKQLPVNSAELDYHHGNVPWQRVINAQGKISPRATEDGTRNQAQVLREEGVEVGRNEMGEFTVDLKRYGWFPAELPWDEEITEEG